MSEKVFKKKDFLSEVNTSKRVFPKKELAQLVISACSQFNINTVVISPGSRNAPLTVGFYNHSKITALSVVDERCAAFFALGIAQQTQQPVAVVCTSGSALLNYYPAIAEAFYSNIPLVIISADRPKHLIDIGDGQTIRQENVFKNHILCSVNLEENCDQQNTNLALLANALKISSTQKGPVHINVPFDEPLYETVEQLQEFNFLTALNTTKKTTVINPDNAIDYTKLASIWNNTKKKMILVGVNYPNDELNKLLDFINQDTSILLLTETTSNIHHKKAIHTIDQLIFSLNNEEFSELKPDILITFGGMIVSKKIKQFLRTHQPTHHWHIDDKTAMNTFFCLSNFIKTTPTHFFKNFNKVTKTTASEYQDKWLTIRDIKHKKHQDYLAKTEHSDLKAFQQVLASIPTNTQLQISNSAVIRYVQLFTLNQTLKVFCNRGTSGIDGSTSTAIGAAYACNNQTVFITGDISFFYDSNALWNNNVKKDFRVILINNAGGGIFKIIPGPNTTNAISYFETPHNLTAKHLCKMYGFKYLHASSTKEVTEKLYNFYRSSKKPKLLEIFTPNNKNNTILKNYFNYLQ
ncbi:2-succinyl-5-enolpyruvyl-6-hydroxy-3-cyclohexene-1-carboxylic-acid synthase [Tenacibaculum sp. UWU-22]|uniref:2-succinyl-5-enolpyruvyl-6-hydroxy-3- cyclohexene-1-carboxylic-acid synthase n=1 Tax=Tenacibaculum sp. UWU-22 TaxID=3234187 RepID=UPI0034DB65CB